MADKPSLFLELDEHSADAGLVTRLEAFLDSLSHYKPRRPAKIEPAKSASSLVNRKIFVPYMGDCSYGMAAAIKAHGRPAEVMRCSDEEGLLIGRRFTTGKECLPCAITIGDMLTTTQRHDFDPAKSAFLMPSSSGPCRFGLYNCMQRLVLKYAALPDVPVVSPNQDGAFYAEFEAAARGKSSSFMLSAWTSMVGIDILGRVLLKIRPYAKNKNIVRQIYDECLKTWIEASEKDVSLAKRKKIMADIAQKFSKIDLDLTSPRPRIGVVGEIYVRSHPFANNSIIKRLEELGSACSLASLAEWVYYMNYTRTVSTAKSGQYKNCLVNIFQDFMQHRIEKSLAAPLEKKFGSLAEHSIPALLSLGKKYIDPSFEGEAVLSVSKINEYFRHGFSGVVNVMPFGCMPSTIVSSITPVLSRDCANMPILNVSFDGTEDVTFATRLEAFFQQCTRRHETLVRAADIFA